MAKVLRTKNTWRIVRSVVMALPYIKQQYGDIDMDNVIDRAVEAHTNRLFDEHWGKDAVEDNRTAIERLLDKCLDDAEMAVDLAINDGIYFGDNRIERKTSEDIVGGYIIDCLEARFDGDRQGFDRAASYLVDFIIRGMEAVERRNI